jgi:hypothetical protein
MENQTLTLISVAISAIAVTIGVYELIKKYKRNLAVNLSWGFPIGTINEGEDQLVFKLLNAGEKDIALSLPIFIKIKGIKKMMCIYNPHSTINQPYIIEAGKSISLWVDWNEIKKGLKQLSNKNEVKIKGLVCSQTNIKFLSDSWMIFSLK